MWKNITKTGRLFSEQGLTTDEVDDIQDEVHHGIRRIVRYVKDTYYPHFNAGKRSEFKMNIDRAKELNSQKNFLGVHKRIFIHLKKMFDMEITVIDELLEFLEQSVPAIQRAFDTDAHIKK